MKTPTYNGNPVAAQLISTKQSNNKTIYMKKLLQNQNCKEKHLLMGFFVIFITCFSSVLYGQNPQTAPLNPEFVKYQEGLNQVQMQSADGHSLGLIPRPVLPNFAKTTQKVLKATSFASKYDLRTAGPGGTSLITSVKDQGRCGSCWAFASMGAIEGYAKKFGIGEYDLSENNLKECHGFVWLPCDGGNSSMASAYLARKSGPISELNDPYNENEVGCTDNVYPEFWVSDIRYIPNDNSIIKQAILDYGALYTTFYWNPTIYNSTNYTYYSTGITSTNHAVLLVGWDDTKVTAGGTGAWIIKNSWGDWWGENGFFYISYNDASVNNEVTSFRNITTPVTNSTQFGYDQLGYTNYKGYGSNIGYGLIRFSPGNKNYTLKKLSTFVPSGPATVSFEVYDDFNGTTLSNLMGSITDKACDLPGYYSFDLPSPVEVSANNDFYIKVYYNTVDHNYPIPVETLNSGYAESVIESEKCWMSANGTNWQAIGSNTSTKADLCIKAYGEYIPCTPPTSQATEFTSSALADNSMTVGWTRGNGDAVLVVARAGSAVNADPESGSSYTANTAFGSGTQIGTGNYVVYNGTGMSVNLTALTSGTTYYYAIYEYNSDNNCYLTPALTGNATTTGISYCVASAKSIHIGYISRVRLNTIDQTSTRGTNGYEDYTSQIATMQIGVNSTIIIDRSATYYVNDSLLIWVDWNKDGDFLDANENVYSSTAPASSYSANFAPPDGATIGTTRMRIRLNNNSYLPNSTPCGNSYYGEVEDYTINVTAACTPPTTQASGFTSSALADNSMTVGWTRGNGNAVLVVARVGSAVNTYPWSEAAYTANATFGSGTQIGNGNYVVYKGTGTSVNITGLTVGTTYHYAIYEYDTTDDCYKTPALVGNVTTTGYCTAGATTMGVGCISRVRLNTIDQTSTWDWGTNGFYEDYTSQVATMQVGVNSTITIDRSIDWEGDSLLIWVDWNKDGDFLDVGENVYSSTAPANSYTTSFSPPVGATIGTTRMRIRLHNNSRLPNSTPCGNSYYGEVEDYSINVTAACTPPTTQATEFTSSALADNSMTVGWIRGNGDAVLVIARAGSAVSAYPWSEAAYTANATFGSGTQIGNGNYVVYNGTGTSVNLTALTSGTTYYYAIYEYNTAASNCYLSPTLTGNATTTGISYCTAGSLRMGEFISNVAIGSINQESGRGTAGYQDYTSQITTMRIGTNVSATISVISPYTSTSDQVLIWVDWNKDGDFTDAGENVYASNGSFASPHTTANFAPPVGATIGTTRIRIRLNDTENGSNITPCGDADWGEVEDYTINVTTLPNPPAAPTANPATGIVQTSFTANWNSSATATGYRLDVATNVGFTAFVSGYNDKDVSNVTSFSITSLTANTSYYYRVRAYNTGGTSPNSGVITTTTLPDPPVAPTANPATSIVQTSFTANWNTSTTATGYRLDVATNIGFTTFVAGYNDKDVSSITTYSVTGLSANTTYFYRVRAYNTGGTSPNSGVITTTTLPNPPAAPTTNPATSIVQTSLTANWSTAATATGYRLDVATNVGFTAFVAGFNDKDISNVTSYSVTGLIQNTTYYYRLRAYNTGGASPNSGTITTTTLPDPPAAPTTKPVTSLLQTSFTANWNASATATGYRLDIATNSTFTAFVVVVITPEFGLVPPVL